MSKRIRIAAAAAIAAGLVAGTAATASAHVVGDTPSPSPTQQTVTPYPTHHGHVTTPWQFDLQQSDIGLINVNDVEATSPIRAQAWRDVQLSPTLDKFVRGPNSVTLRHDSIGLADITVNRYTCTVTLDQPNGRFRIVNGTGTGAGFQSFNGRFDLTAEFSWNLVRGHCPLAFLSSQFILRQLANGGHLLPQPSFDDVAVQGRAQLVRSAPIHIFAPTASPDDSESA